MEHRRVQKTVLVSIQINQAAAVDPALVDVITVVGPDVVVLAPQPSPPAIGKHIVDGMIERKEHSKENNRQPQPMTDPSTPLAVVFQKPGASSHSLHCALSLGIMNATTITPKMLTIIVKVVAFAIAWLSKSV